MRKKKNCNSNYRFPKLRRFKFSRVTFKKLLDFNFKREEVGERKGGPEETGQNQTMLFDVRKLFKMFPF